MPLVHFTDFQTSVRNPMVFAVEGKDESNNVLRREGFNSTYIDICGWIINCMANNCWDVM
jgi:hypothetical protein